MAGISDSKAIALATRALSGEDPEAIVEVPQARTFRVKGAGAQGYVVTLYARPERNAPGAYGRDVCTCPNGGASCYHVKAARLIAARERPDAGEVAAKGARAAAAMVEPSGDAAVPRNIGGRQGANRRAARATRGGRA